MSKSSSGWTPTDKLITAAVVLLFAGYVASEDEKRAEFVPEFKRGFTEAYDEPGWGGN